MGTTASLGKGEPLSQAISNASETRGDPGHKRESGDSPTESAESRKILSLPATEQQQHHENLRALNTIQRQQEELTDLANQLQKREEELRLIRDLRTRDGPATPDESLKLRDLRIRQLEESLAKERAEAAKQKSRHKKKCRDLVGQLAELRQSTTIRIMELRQEVHQLNLENRQLKERLGLSETSLVSVTSPRPSNADSEANKATNSNSSGNKSLIVELSTQLSDQAEQIRRLRSQLQDSQARIAQLQQTPDATASTASLTPTSAAVNQSQKHQRQPQSADSPMEQPKATKSQLLNSELSFVSQASTDLDLRQQGGDTDSVYSDDTLLYVEMQHQQQPHQYQLSSASANTRADVKSGIILDSYKQRTIDKLLQD